MYFLFSVAITIFVLVFTPLKVNEIEVVFNHDSSIKACTLTLVKIQIFLFQRNIIYISYVHECIYDEVMQFSPGKIPYKLTLIFDGVNMLL